MYDFSPLEIFTTFILPIIYSAIIYLPKVIFNFFLSTQKSDFRRVGNIGLILLGIEFVISTIILGSISRGLWIQWGWSHRTLSVFFTISSIVTTIGITIGSAVYLILLYEAIKRALQKKGN